MKRILIVDDSKFWRLVLENLLVKKGYEVIVAEDAMQAIDIALKEFPDVIISDYNMPGISGLQLCLYIRSIPAFKNAGIAVLTGSDDVINAFWAEHSGADRFISKLLPKEQLENAIVEFVKGNYYTEKSLRNFLLNNIYDVLEQKMRTEILNREILSLIEYSRDEYYVIRELKKFLENFSTLRNIAFLVLSPVEGRIYNFGFDVQKGILKKKLLRQLEKPIEPSSWLYVGDYGPELSPKEEPLYYVVRYSDNEIGIIAFTGIGDLRNITKVLTEASESIGLLFNTLNTFQEFKIGSTIDGLTGLFNKKELLRFLEETHKLSKISKGEYFVAMFDIDNFKKINDTYGHLTGDEVLKLVAKILKESVEEKGIAGRYGGEEFTLVLTKITKNEVVELIEGILKRIRNTEFPHGKCTVSCGVVSSTEFETPIEVLKAADELLYISKKTGKDKASYMFLINDKDIEKIIQEVNQGLT
ncbi:MAG: diguanylate cyclase [Fervidobacterium sp.]